MCICYLVWDTFLTLKHAEHSFTHIMSRINYVSNVWDSCIDVHIKKLVSVHKRAVKVLYAALQMLPGGSHISVDPLPLKQHPQYNECILVHKVVHNKSPAYVRQELHAGTRSNVNSRSGIFVLHKTRIDLFKISFSFCWSYCWHMIPSDFRDACSIDSFKYKILQCFCSDFDMRQSDC